ncbi:MAG TPA: thioredoxin domain-containing protein [Burkholderiales bacterium]|nr:thioredoxin domain-containing protein [Burkholderiales bacterium]
MHTPAAKAELAVPIHAGDHILGARDAPVVVVEYGDFECPSCAQAAPALQIVRQHFEPQVCLVFRHYPLTEIHPHAMLAAEAAEAAAAQGRFWPMHDLLFRHELHLGRDKLLYCARAAGLDMRQFERDIDAGVHRARVQADIESGRASHIMSTPAIFVNGERCDVSFGMERLEEWIARILSSGRDSDRQ